MTIDAKTLEAAGNAYYIANPFNEKSDHEDALLAALTAAAPLIRAQVVATITDEAKSICDEIAEIMRTYREQENECGYVDTPGGLEHMGDVWRLLHDWDDRYRRALNSAETKEPRS